MKADISADFHAPAKRFSGTRAQAGRVLTEADFNSAFDVLDDTIETLVRTLLCAAGSPDSGLQVQDATPVTLILPDGSTVTTYDLTIAPGTFVLGGRATLLTSAISLVDQADWMSRLLTPDVLPGVPTARTDLVWVEQIDGAVRAVEDRELQERALPGDTTTRIRPQIKIRVLEDVPPECYLAHETLAQTLRLGGHALSDDRTERLSAARLGLAFVDDGPELDPCAPGGARGYLGAENHTLKVMLTAPDRFVWAYDHGEPLYRVQVDAATNEVVFLTEPRDPLLYPLPDQVIEVLPWDVFLPNGEKAAAPLGHLARLTGHYDPRSRRGAYDGSLPADWQAWLDALPPETLGRDDDPPRYFYARIWQAPLGGAGTDMPTGTDLVLPETGVALHFAGTGIAGDFWTAALRPNAPEMVHPWNLMIDPTVGEVPSAPPIGPRRFHAPLALITWPGTSGAPEIDDCRNRFRRLCRIKGCCTYQVGDGHNSFGDFNTVQEAVDALPTEGGEICLLPGTHTGAIDLRGRRDIKIHGCGYRSRVEIAANAQNPAFPGVHLSRAQRIQFCDFLILGAGGPVFGGRDARDIDFDRLRIGAEMTAAIALARSRGVSIANCEIATDELAAALETGNIPTLLPLVYLDGRDLTVTDNIIRASYEGRNRNRVALGGLQIGGRSQLVRIEDNLIEGGNGHAITLGSVIGQREPDGDDIIITIPPWISIDDDGCVKFTPGGTIRLPGQDGGVTYRSAGPLRDVRIRDNRLTRHGGCGISVAHWFIARPRDGATTLTEGRTSSGFDEFLQIEEAAFEGLDDIEIEDLTIDDNKITHCMEINLASSLPIEAAFNSGYGGITLASAVDTTIDGNQITDCGTEGRSPICGIYIRYAERLQINGNRISGNGRPASLTDPLLVGNIGGIVVGQVDGVEEGLGTQLREVPAAVVTHNTVVTPEGRALELIGSGQMLVQSNSFTTHGNNIGGVILFLLFSLLRENQNTTVGAPLTNNQQIEGQFRAAVSQIGAATVLIFNTGLNRNIAIWGAAITSFLSQGKVVQQQQATQPPPPAAEAAQPTLEEIEAGLAARPVEEVVVTARRDERDDQFLADIGRVDRAQQRLLPRGPVSFSDNMVTFDSISPAITLALSSVGIVSMDDVGMHDNHLAVDLTADFILTDALVFGLGSVRVQGNRFREILVPPRGVRGQGLGLPPTFFSAVTLGILNATEMNQGTYCFISLGFKKPRIILTGSEKDPRATLDTNRHMAPDALCARWRALSRFGTETQ